MGKLFVKVWSWLFMKTALTLSLAGPAPRSEAGCRKGAESAFLRTDWSQDKEKPRTKRGST